MRVPGGIYISARKSELRPHQVREALEALNFRRVDELRERFDRILQRLISISQVLDGFRRIGCPLLDAFCNEFYRFLASLSLSVASVAVSILDLIRSSNALFD